MKSSASMGIVWTLHVALLAKDIVTMLRVKSKSAAQREAKVYSSPSVLAVLLQDW